MFRETVAVYCANQTEHINTVCVASSLLENTSHLRYQEEIVNVYGGNRRCKNRMVHTLWYI
jgi:hypothetical protein